MYKLKSIARRGTNLGAAIALAIGAVVPALVPVSSAYADALNPLTERSLTLSSSSPGWAYTDGSGNSTYAPPNSGANGQKTGNYFSFKTSSAALVKSMSFQYCTKSAGHCEVPGSDGTPGTDTDSTSDLNVNYPSATEISNTPTTGAGKITLTANSDEVDGTGTDFVNDLVLGGTIVSAAGHSYVIKSIGGPTSLTLTTKAVETEDGGGVGVAYTTSDFNQVVNINDGSVTAVPGYTNNNPKYGGTGDPAEAAKNVTGNFVVMYYDGSKWVQSTGWTASSRNVQDADTGNSQIVRPTNNYIVITNTSGQSFTQFQQVKVLFFANGTNYITNPGEGAFFVKINTYKTQYDNTFNDDGSDDTSTVTGIHGLAPATDDNVIDGGVTVANVMNESIQITTKVLETMQFSVGTVDPNTLDSTDGDATNPSTFEKAIGVTTGDNNDNHHKTCDIIRMGMTTTGPQNVLQLGNQSAESSLETDKTYATHSYWRLSSNSSAGATVYYSGHTLSNTSGDEIAPIGTTASVSAAGSEQFGLALDTTALAGGNGFNDAAYGVDYTTAGTYEHGADDPGGVAPTIHDSTLTDLGATNSGTWDYTLLNKSFHMPRLDPLVPEAAYANGSGSIDGTGTAAKFAFDPMSDTVPAAIANESSQVVDCVTGKMRYIANIAATTPAGIYTTKVNYIAAPQY